MRVVLAALVALSSAGLAPPALAQGDGSLTRASCVSLTDRPGCAPARAIGDPQGVAVSPGGGNVYVTSMRSDAVAVFRRNRGTGALRQLRGRAGCVRNGGGRRCRRGRALRDPFSVVVSPDGRNVYVVSLASQAIDAFRRSRRTGALRQVGSRPLAGPSSLALSPNGRFLYVGTTNGVAAFRRNPRTGRLVRLGAPAGATPVVDVAVDPAGDNLYASSQGVSAVIVFDLEDGVPSRAGCISESGAGGCTAGRTLNGPFGFALSPDGRQLYTAAEFSGAVAILAPDPATGTLSQPAGPLGCIRDGGGLDCATARFMGHPSQIEVSRDGRNAYVRAEGSDLVVLRRNRATGELSQLPGRKGCIAPRNTDCTDSGGLAVGAIALSSDGRNAYVTSEPNLTIGVVSVYSRAR
jgi:DNA-binding beta-propeller fold protein YncE